MNDILEQDINEFAKSFVLSSSLTNSRFLITGITGLIGSTMAHCLLSLNNGIAITAPVRNIAKAKAMFRTAELLRINFIETSLTELDQSKLGHVDYVIHCAAPTASKYFIEHAVETFNTIYEGTKTLLEFSKRGNVKSFVFLSSLEVYGEIHDDTSLVSEDVQGYLNPLSVRSSYPMAKRAAENLCCAYAIQYGVPTKIARLTQTTGAGISKDDNRIIAQFARLAAKGNDIVLHTTGESARPYCYTTDCISALLYILLKGSNASCYNVANEDTYISAKDLATFLRDTFYPEIHIRIELNENMGYAPPTKHRLSAQKLKDLGWMPSYDLKKIFQRLIAYLSKS